MNQKKDYVLRWIPKYSIIPLITALVLNTLVYSGTMVLCKGLYHHDFRTSASSESSFPFNTAYAVNPNNAKKKTVLPMTFFLFFIFPTL